MAFAGAMEDTIRPMITIAEASFILMYRFSHLPLTNLHLNGEEGLFRDHPPAPYVLLQP